MHLRISSIFVTAIMLTTISACNVDDTRNSRPNGMPVDSARTIAKHSGEHTGIHPTIAAGNTLPLSEQVDQWQHDLFPDYKIAEMDPMEAYPKYEGAQETIFRRMRRVRPISNSYGKAVYPRLLMKVYRFSSGETLAREVEAWLNTLGSATKGIRLGQDVRSVKSPPLLCAVVQNDFLVVQTGCVYEGEEWSASVSRFFERMKAMGAAYAWQVKCDGGEMSYGIGGRS
ncbi:MAG: hypothetical protein RLZZ165_1721 [Bacteroidota bacterium]|jgi:hypothetical protein